MQEPISLDTLCVVAFSWSCGRAGEEGVLVGAVDLGVDIRALYMAGAMRPRAFNFSEEAGDGGRGWT